jgi:translocation and assembly module TamB
LTNHSPSKSRRWLKLFLKTGSAIALGLFLLGIIGIGIAQWWAKDNLAPIISKELSKTLKRPIDVGEIEDISLNEIRISNANIPAHGSDANRLEVREIIINFNPFKLALERTFKFDVRLIAPSIYIAQNVRGNWANIPTQKKAQFSPVKIEVGTIKIEDAKIVIVPYSQKPQPVIVSQFNLQADVNDAQERVTFNAGAQFGKRGQIQLQGNSLIANGETQLAVKGQKLDAAAATRIVKIPEVKIDRGTVDGELNLAILPEQYLRINSNLLVNNGKLTINNVPRSLDAINGSIQVSERDVKFNNVSTKYDRVAGIVNGDLNYYTGYHLRAKTAAITLPDLVKSIDVKSPFSLAGAAVAQLQLTGKLDRPILAGKFNNSQLSQVDRVQVDRVNGKFRLADGRIKLDAIAQPKLGGKVSTQGEIQLLKTPQTRFEIQADNLPGDTLSRLYGAKLPAQMQVGATSVRGTISGAGADIYTNLRVVSPQATYPVSAELQITPQGKTLVRDAQFAVAGGKVKATGEVNATNWRLNLQPQALDPQQLAKIVELKLPDNYRGKLAGTIQAAGLNNDLEIDRIQAQGRLNLQLAAGQIQADRIQIDRGNWQAQISSKAIDLQLLEPDGLTQGESSLPTGIVSGDFNVSGNSLKTISPKIILARGRGKVKLKAGEIESESLTIANGDWQGIFTTKDLQLADLNVPVKGKLSGKFNLAGNLDRFTPESIRGMGIGEINLPQGKIVSNNFQIDRGKWQGNLQSSSLVLGGLAPEIPLKFKDAKVDANVRVAGDLQQLKPEAITVAGSGKLSLAGGSILARQLDIRAGKWRGNFGLDRLKLGSVSDEIPAELEAAKLTGNFIAAGDLKRLDPAQTQITGNGELNLVDGKIRATGFKLDAGSWSSNLAISNLKLGDFNRQLSPQFQTGKLAGNFNVAGNVDRLTPTAIDANGNGKLKLANGGEIRAENFQAAAGAWQSDLAVRGLGLGAINQALPQAIQAGVLFGNFRAAGNLQSPDLDRIQASGNGRVQSLLGGNLQVNNLAINNGKWQSNIIADRLNIGELAKFAPPNITNVGRLNGQLTANWQIDGNLQHNSPANLRVLGQTRLTNFQFGGLKFDPNLIGNIQANPGQGVDIAFAGKTDKLALSLDRNLQLQSFDVRQQGIIAKGNVDGKMLNTNIEQLPIALLKPWIPSSTGIQAYRLDGIATGKLAIDLGNFQVAGNQIEITNPTFGAFVGEKLLTNFRYANGRLNLDRTELQRGAYTYLIDASVDAGASTPIFQAKLQAPNGSIEDIRNLFQIFSLNDLFTPLNRRKYGTAADLAARPDRIANRPQPLYNELRRLSELRRWLNREADRQEENNIIPDIGNLQGDFSGEIAIANNPKSGLSADFNLSGANWQLERYRFDRLTATGNWRNGKLHLDPLNLTIENSQIDVAGDFQASGQNAKVNVQNFPVEWLTSLTELPVTITGGINMSAQISGNLANPHASGEISLSNGKLNREQLQETNGSFNYWDGRLNFTSFATFTEKKLANQADRIKITGSIPYQLPFAITAPASRDLNIDLSLQDRGLQILDVFSKQKLKWIDGQGKIAMKIEGKMKPSGGIESLSASGIANITNGKIQSAAIPEPLTEIDGNVIFDFDRIDVQKLTAKLNRGRVAIEGILPIADSFSIEPSKQLNIQLNNIAVNVPEKYSGDVNGKLTILGTALIPILTGDIKLSNGQVLIPDSPNTTTTVLGIQPALPAAPNPNALQLRNLQLTLGDNLQITRPPILNFFATGKLEIDGTIDNPRPFGQVQLQKGSVNLFTTQFRLASGPQTADFFPTLGTEPVLNLRLFAKTLESTSSSLSQRNSVSRINQNGEINRPADFYTTSLGSVQTVQVEARIAGLASQLTQRLELASTPARTQPEIVLLLGGALAERLGAGDNIGLGVVSLASSTLLNNIQDRISDLFSLSDFRLFPTILTDAKTNTNSTLGVAAEVGTEITPKVSASVFKILTNSESPFYSLRYRVNDQILIRSSTNLFGENRAIVEFEQRF